jgi:DNA (cytosine-5)-methyltransferase 1
VDITIKPPTVLSLCSGYGGIELGLERVFGSIAVLAHVEIEAFAIANLVNKMETGRLVPAPVWTNLKTFKAGLFRGMVDILTGGYPCQPFSAAGKRLGSEDPRHLWPYVLATIQGCEPEWVFLENVEGHISKGIVQVLADLEAVGYRVKAGIFSAEEVGAPHRRKRVFILAHRECGRLEGHSRNGAGCFRQIRQVQESDRSTGEKCLPQREELGNTESNDERGLSISTMYRERVAAGRSSSRWPTRPGEQQYEWEEPRVVADTKESRLSKPPQRTKSKTTRQSGSEYKGVGQTQSLVGRTTHGFTRDRVDRLRLLGNGVVPQTAELAFRMLYAKLVKGVSANETRLAQMKV